MKVNRKNTKPLYIQVKEKIIQKIKAGVYVPNEKIPSERQLCSVFNVSRITIRQAIEELIKSGYLYSVHGKGTFVTDNKTGFGNPLGSIYSFQDLLKSKNRKGKTKILYTDTILADLETASILEVGVGEPLFNIKLLGYSEQNSVVFYNSYFNQKIGEDLYEIALSQEDENKAFSSIDLYQIYSGKRPVKIKQSFESQIVSGELANYFPENSSLMKVTSIFLSMHEEPIEYRKAYYLGDEYIFYMTREVNFD